METKITKDGSITVFSPLFNQNYHSFHGAKQESERVYIELGLAYVASYSSQINILEIGFGTGLNAFLTAEYAVQHQIYVNYTGLEPYPLASETYSELDKNMHLLHKLPWDSIQNINPNFDFFKSKSKIEDYKTEQKFDLIYFDAFSPDSQPELWTTELFNKIASMMNRGAVLSTYSSKVLIQQNLKAAGFTIQKHNGPRGKREVLRAIYSN